MSAAAELALDEFDVISPAISESGGYPHDLWKRLRAESPIHFFPDGPMPYWAVTKHEDITHIGRSPDLLISGPRIMVRPDASGDMGDFVRPTTLIELDNPRHRVIRRMISDRFTHRAPKKVHAEVGRIAQKVVDDALEQGDGELDFGEQFARLEADPSLLKPAVEEVLRWSSAISTMPARRRPTPSSVVRPSRRTMSSGSSIRLQTETKRSSTTPRSSASTASRTETSRSASASIFCAGAHVARLELEMAYKYFLPRLSEVELAGPVDRLRSNLVGGIKRLPLRYKIA
jgi:cytochrome P450